MAPFLRHNLAVMCLVLFGLVVAIAPTACMLMPCCANESECCEGSCHDQAEHQTGPTIELPGANGGHCLCSGLPCVASAGLTDECHIVETDQEQNAPEIAPLHALESVYRPPISSC